MIYDTVIISGENELDLLECRFREMEGFPVTHVIAESEEDYSGNAKPLYFWDEYKTRFARWHGRWTHVRAHAGELTGEDPAARKDSLRDFLSHGLASAVRGDLILVSAADEIPARWVIGELLRDASAIEPPVALEMRWCAYTHELTHPLPWRGTVVQRAGTGESLTGIRRRRTSLPAVLGAGTRLSMYGESVPEDGRHPDGHALWGDQLGLGALRGHRADHRAGEHGGGGHRHLADHVRPARPRERP